MDFLEIRKKAKERARARAGGDAARPAEGAGPGDGAAKPSGRGRTRRDERRAAPPAEAAGIAGGAGAPGHLRGLPPAAGGQQPDPAADDASGLVLDGRFTTWRPGDGAPPFVLPPPAPGPAAPPHEDDFKLIALPAPAAPPAAATRSPLDPLDEFFFHPGEEAPELPHLDAPLEAPPADPGVLPREEYLTFLLGTEEYAIAVPQVREVIRAPPITEVPRAPAHILGVVTVRGEVVAIVDPRRRLGLPPAGGLDCEAKVVIVEPGDGACGLLVDRIADVVRLEPGSIEPCPQGIAGHGGDCLAGIGRDGERIFTVLDLGALLRRGAGRGADDPGARRADAGA